jgi:hypothetical protein
MSGCATSIHVKVIKPAEVNMSGARKLAIFPVSVPSTENVDSMSDIFKNSILRIKKKKFADTENMKLELGEYATDNLVSNLVNTNYFEIISPTDVERSLEYYDASEIDPIMLGALLGAEAIVLSEITDLQQEKERFIVTEKTVEKKKIKIRDKKTDKMVTKVIEEEIEVEVPWVKRTVYLRYTYWVINTETDKLIASKSFYQSKHNQVKEEEKEKLQSYEQMARNIISGNLKAMTKQLAPYETWEARVMMNDKTKDPRMKEADNLVKGNVYEKALDLYLEIWFDNQNPAAGVNAAIMYEVLGDVDSALALIEKVLDVSAESKVMYEYKRLKKVKEDLIRLEEQMGDT